MNLSSRAVVRGNSAPRLKRSEIKRNLESTNEASRQMKTKTKKGIDLCLKKLENFAFFSCLVASVFSRLEDQKTCGSFYNRITCTHGVLVTHRDRAHTREHRLSDTTRSSDWDIHVRDRGPIDLVRTLAKIENVK